MKSERMAAALVVAKEFEYDILNRSADWLTVTLNRKYEDGIFLSLVETPQGEIHAVVSYLPEIGMFKVVSHDFSWPHKSFQRMFETPIRRMAAIHRASQL